MSFRVTLILMAAALLSSSAFAQSAQRGPVDRSQLLADSPALGEVAIDPEILDRIVVLLSGYEYFPSGDDLLAVTPDPTPYLLTIVYDTHGRWLPTHHHRAVAALSYFPTATTRSHLSYLLTSPDTSDLMRHHVINALANGFGDDALIELEPYLYSNDVQLQLTAVAAIGEIRTDQSVTVLQTALAAEPHRLVEERIERTLTAPRPVTPATY